MRNKQDLMDTQELSDTQEALTKQTNTADKTLPFVSQTVTGKFVVHESGDSKNKSGTMALYINAESGNIRLDVTRDTPYFLQSPKKQEDLNKEMTRDANSYLLSGKKFYSIRRTYYSNGTKPREFQPEHATTTEYTCSVAELPGGVGSQFMDCVREQFSKRWFQDQYELKDSYKQPPATGPSALANLLDLYVKSNYGVHFGDDGGITKLDMSEETLSFDVAKLDGTSGEWETEYSLGNPEAKDPTVFDAPVLKPDEAPTITDGPNSRFSRQCFDGGLAIIPLRKGENLKNCLTR
jgi:hypothetical protein